MANHIENEIKKLGEKYNLPYILDGIVNEEKFRLTSPKILWILKEVNDSDPDEGYFDMRDVLRKFADQKAFGKGWSNTFQKLTYTTYGILYDYKLYDETPNRYDKPEMIEVLNQIAYINVNKLSGSGAVTNQKNLAAKFEENRELLQKQINEINPDIIIGGGTMDLFWKDLNLEPNPELRVGHAWGLKHDGRIWIKAYHPSHRFNEKDYMDDIVGLTSVMSKLK